MRNLCIQIPLEKHRDMNPVEVIFQAAIRNLGAEDQPGSLLGSFLCISWTVPQSLYQVILHIFLMLVPHQS